MPELIIIGAGVAGISCAIYAKRANLDFLIFEKGLVGGQLNLIPKIDNFPGFKEISGHQLIERLKEHLKALDIKINTEEVKSLKKENEFFRVETDKKTYFSKSVVVATGSVERKLGIEGEEEFLGKGVSYCAICDGYFFKDKYVCVIGGGNTALESALYLSNLAKKVYIIHRRDRFRGFESLARQIAEKNNIEVIFNHILLKIKGTQVVESVFIKDTQTQSVKELPVDGVFVCVGRKGVTEFINKSLIETDPLGFIKEAKTSGFFFCGDVISKPHRQIGLSLGEGIQAFFKAYEFLRGF